MQGEEREQEETETSETRAKMNAPKSHSQDQERTPGVRGDSSGLSLRQGRTNQ